MLRGLQNDTHDVSGKIKALVDATGENPARAREALADLHRAVNATVDSGRMVADVGRYITSTAAGATLRLASSDEVLAAQNAVRKALGDRAVLHLDSDPGSTTFHAVIPKAARDTYPPFAGKTDLLMASKAPQFGALTDIVHHEVAHGIFARMLSDEHWAPLADRAIRAVQSDKVMAQLEKDWGWDRGNMDYIRKQPEEAFAYAYQSWVAGRLKLPPAARGFFAKAAQFIRQALLGLQRDDQFLGALFEATRDGYLAGEFVDVTARGLAEGKDHSAERGYRIATPNETAAGDFSLRGRSTGPTVGDEKNAQEFIRKVLGPHVGIKIRDDLSTLAASLGLQGSPSGLHFSERQADGTLRHLIGLALGAPGTTKYHEAAHGLFRELDNLGDTGRELKRVLHQLAGTAWMQKQLREFLKNDPEAVKQLADPEEAVAFMFEAYLADPKGFKLRPTAETMFQRVKDWIARTLGYLRTDERGQKIMDAFAAGDFAKNWNNPGALRKQLLEVGKGKPMVRAADEMTSGLREQLNRAASTSVGWLKETGLPAFNSIADAMHTSVGSEEDKRLSYLQAVERTHAQFTNKLFLALHNADVEQQDKALRFLRGQTVSGGVDAKTKEIVDTWRGIAKDMLERYAKAGIPIGNLGPNYFPRVWDSAKIAADKDNFIQLLQRNGVADPEAAFAAITRGEHVSPDMDLTIPAFDSRKARVLPDMPADAIAPYLSDDLNAIMLNYVRQATRKLEFSRRFGIDGERLENAFKAAREQGATDEELARARQVVDGMLGNVSLIDPRWQKVNDWAITVSNVGLLGLSLFNSMIDPLGLALRSGDMREAWDGFKRGTQDIKKWVKEDPALLSKEDLLAMAFGTVSVAESAVGAVSDVSGGAKKINDALFKYNGVEGWTRSMRVQATLGAFKFIEKHLGRSDPQSQRFMRELNLTEQDVQRTPEGYLIRDPANEKLTDAVNRYVDSVVLKPNRAMRPPWANDPHYAVLWHLKSFSYAFEKVFNERVLHEASFGNYKPLGVLATFAPVAMASYWLKLMLSGGGELPNYAKAWDTLDWLQVGMARAGYGGISGIWTGAATDPVFAAGPVVNAVADVLGGGGSDKPVGVKAD